ncbi:MAG: helicase, family [Gemmatimonadetes bacterium]|nr:helicase, family [Gemmatimonadota bacterium]
MVEVSTTPPSERFPGRPPEGRVVVIAPTRAACETIEIGVGLTGVETILNREHGAEIRDLARTGKGFGIVAGTGTGKTLSIRPLAEEIVGKDLRVGVVNREREATPETPSWNVVIVTTGIARRWLQDDLITADDIVVVDEIHQTSAELELCLALAKRAGCRFVWLSATVDPTFYKEYLDSATVIESSAFDPTKAATVRVSNTQNPIAFLGERFMRHVAKERRGVAVFVPTRAGTEEIAKVTEERWKNVTAVYYHGGEPVAKLRPFLEDDGAPHPFILSMTSAGQSALNIRGLDTVVIEDARFTTIVQRGRSVLTRLPLGANEILQMAGRVHGRVEGGEVWILSEREIDFASLTPTAPEFQLAGDPERVALTCADMGVRADDLDLPVPLDRIAYRRAVEMLERRGLILAGRLTEYGRKVEVLPVDRAWGELLVQSEQHLIPLVATCASIESLHRMLRQDNDIGQYVVPGSDHLTIHNLYRDALEMCGALGSVYGLPRHVFDEKALAEWAEERGVLVRSIEDGALAIASIYRSLDQPLPRTLPKMNGELARDWRRLVARVMPFSLVIDEVTAWGEEVRVSKTSVCGSWGAVAGNINFFADRFGRARGSIDGTQLPYELLLEFAQGGEPEVVYDPEHRRHPLRLRRTRVYHGFELDSEEEAIEAFPPEVADLARRALAEALIAGIAHHPDLGTNRAAMRELREVYRRSGGTATGGQHGLVDYVAAKLAGAGSYAAFLETPIRVDADELVPRADRERWMALPDTITLHGREFPLDYHMEGDLPVVRARVPDALLQHLDEEDLPTLDRPLRWTVLRGRKEALRADSLDEARLMLDQGPSRPRRDRGEGGGGGGGSRGHGKKGGGGHAQGEGRRKGQRAHASRTEAEEKKGPGAGGRKHGRGYKPKPPKGGGKRGGRH